MGSLIPSISVSTEVCAGGAQRHLAGRDVAAGGADPGNPVAVDGEAGDLAVLDQVDPGPAGAARVSPRRRSRVWRSGPRLISGIQDG